MGNKRHRESPGHPGGSSRADGVAGARSGRPALTLNRFGERMNQRSIPFAAAAVAGLLLGGCSSMSVTRDFDDGYSFRGATGYAWLDAPVDATGINEEGARRVRAAVDAELSKRGFAQVPVGEADLVVAARGGTADRMVYDTYGYGTGRWWGYENTTAVQRTETEGELIVDIYDASRKELVWRGSATDALDPDATPQERTAKVREAVSRLFEGFPPGL